MDGISLHEEEEIILNSIWELPIITELWVVVYKDSLLKILWPGEVILVKGVREEINFGNIVPPNLVFSDFSIREQKKITLVTRQRSYLNISWIGYLSKKDIEILLNLLVILEALEVNYRVVVFIIEVRVWHIIRMNIRENREVQQELMRNNFIVEVDVWNVRKEKNKVDSNVLCYIDYSKGRMLNNLWQHVWTSLDSVIDMKEKHNWVIEIIWTDNMIIEVEVLIISDLINQNILEVDLLKPLNLINY